MDRIPTRNGLGFTAVELLIVISVVALLLVFGVPLVNSSTTDCDLEPAVEMTEKSVAQARKLARLYRTDVVMRLETGADHPPRVTVAIPRGEAPVDMSEVRQRHELPGSVELLGGDLEVQFDANGDVALPALVLLASRNDRHEVHKLLIE